MAVGLPTWRSLPSNAGDRIRARQTLCSDLPGFCPAVSRLLSGEKPPGRVSRTSTARTAGTLDTLHASRFARRVPDSDAGGAADLRWSARPPHTEAAQFLGRPLARARKKQQGRSHSSQKAAHGRQHTLQGCFRHLQDIIERATTPDKCPATDFQKAATPGPVWDAGPLPLRVQHGSPSSAGERVGAKDRGLTVGGDVRFRRRGSRLM